MEIVSESPAYEDQFHGIFSSESSPNKIFTKLNQNRRTASDPYNNPFQQRSKLTVNNQTIYGNGKPQLSLFFLGVGDGWMDVCVNGKHKALIDSIRSNTVRAIQHITTELE